MVRNRLRKINDKNTNSNNSITYNINKYHIIRNIYKDWYVKMKQCLIVQL